MDKHPEKNFKITTIIFYLFIIFIFWCGIVIFATNNWIYEFFGEVFFDAILFTLTSPTDGDAAETYKWQYLIQMGIVTLKALVFGIILIVLIVRQTKFSRMLSKIMAVVAVLVFVWSLFYTDSNYHVVRYFFDKNQLSTMIDDNYVKLEPTDITFPPQKRNLIFIMLESIENTYNNPEYFAEPLVPLLRELQAENIAFHKHYQVLGTSWSAAGLTAYLFGVPMAIPFGVQGRIMEHRKDFLPGAISMLELLEANDYQVILTKGHVSKFAGWDKLFGQHAPNSKVYDQTYFEENFPDLYASIPNKWEWGLPDAFIFENTKKILLERDESQPFFLVMVTVDTHITYENDVNLYATERKYGDYRDAFAQTDRIVYDFVRWVQQQDFYENTTIVLLGDHLLGPRVMGEVELPLQRTFKREIFNVVINPAISPEWDVTETRQIASFDFAPTMLESIGVILPQRRFGIGTSLLSAEPTLLERVGMDDYQNEMQKRSVLFHTFY